MCELAVRPILARLTFSRALSGGRVFDGVYAGDKCVCVCPDFHPDTFHYSYTELTSFLNLILMVSTQYNHCFVPRFSHLSFCSRNGQEMIGRWFCA